MFRDRCVLIQNQEILPKLLEVLELVLRKKRPSHGFEDGYSVTRSHFKTTGSLGKKSVSIINECLLNHRFDEAAKLLWVMCQDRSCFDLVLYKGIMIVLDNYISNEDIETIKTVTRDIRKLRHVNRLELQLEYLIYALRKDINDTEDSYYLMGKNAARRPIKKIPCIEQLYTAYTTLLNYITWANISQSEQSSQSNKEFALTIIHSFKQLINNPGIWDIFVLKIIEMLEYYEQYDELEEILKKYVEMNQNHINAYIYLCVHLHKHNADPEIFIQYAKILSNLCPSDERVLLLVQKWDELGKNLKKCLKILFAFLDYPINGNKILGWQLLSIHLHRAISSKISSLLEVINSAWKKRVCSWTYMYFKLSNLNADASELAIRKVKVLSILQPDHEYIKYAEEKFPNITEHLLKMEISPVTYEDLRSLCELSDDIKRR